MHCAFKATLIAQVHLLSKLQQREQVRELLQSLPLSFTLKASQDQEISSETDLQTEAESPDVKLEHDLAARFDECRDQLAWDVTVRNVSAAIEGYKELLSILEDSQVDFIPALLLHHGQQTSSGILK